MGTWWRREIGIWRIGLAGECRIHGLVVAAAAVGLAIISVLAAWLFGATGAGVVVG